jgi:Protein tyrosine and serine/threonine kinase
LISFLNFHRGYLAPEYAMRGHLTEKTDVFAFGVLVLEVVSGRPNADSNQEPDQVYLLDWVLTILSTNLNPFMIKWTMLKDVNTLFGW